MDAREHAEDPVGVFCGKLEAVQHFADLEADASGGAGFDVTGLVQDAFEGVGESLAIVFCGRRKFGYWCCGFGNGRMGVARQLIEADGNGLAEVHGFLHGLCGDADNGRAVVDVFVAEAVIFGAKDDGKAAGGEDGGEFPAECGQREDRAGGMPLRNGCRAEDERAIGNGLGECGEFAGGGENSRGADGGPGAAPGVIVGLDDA